MTFLFKFDHIIEKLSQFKKTYFYSPIKNFIASERRCKVNNWCVYICVINCRYVISSSSLTLIEPDLLFTFTTGACFMTHKMTQDRARKRASKFIDLHPFRTHSPSRPFCVRCTFDPAYLPAKWRPTCFTHDARIDGIGKKRARDYTGGLKSAASVNREFYHERVLSLENCSTNLIAARESRYSREHSGIGYASKQEKCLVARRSFPDCFRLAFLSIESRNFETVKDKKENYIIWNI